MATGRWVTLAGDNNINIATSGVKHFTKKEIEDMYKRFSHLASDPAKGNKISPGSIEEAVIAFAAEKGNIIPHRVEREKTGLSEFIDARGITWDVKSPVSPTFSGAWTFDPHHQLMKIRHDLSQGDRTLLNLTRCNAKDTKTLLNLLKDELEPEERSLIYILLNKEAIEL